MKLKITAKIIDDQNANIDHNLHNLILMNLISEIESENKFISNELFECPNLNEGNNKILLTDMDITSLNYVVNTIIESSTKQELIKKYKENNDRSEIHQLISNPQCTLSLLIEQYIGEPYKTLPPVEYKDDFIIIPHTITV